MTYHTPNRESSRLHRGNNSPLLYHTDATHRIHTGDVSSAGVRVGLLRAKCAAYISQPVFGQFRASQMVVGPQAGYMIDIAACTPGEAVARFKFGGYI